MNNGNLKSMRIIQIIVFVAIVVGCLSRTYATETSSAEGKDVQAVAQAANDSIIAPNVFTPNNDGVNDIFEVTASNGGTVSLKVFSRAGVLIFSIEAKRCRWDGYSSAGQQMANGVYYYTAEVKGASPKITKCGFVHLYR